MDGKVTQWRISGDYVIGKHFPDSDISREIGTEEYFIVDTKRKDVTLKMTYHQYRKMLAEREIAP